MDTHHSAMQNGKRKMSAEGDDNLHPQKMIKGHVPIERTDKTCLVKNLPRSYNNSKIKKIFNDCGVITSIDTCDSLDKKSRYARLEFTNEDGALAALTKTYRKVGSNEIEVTMLKNCTLWITNFPPNYSIRDLRQMLLTVNVTPIQIRMPSHRFNANRRFCYADLVSEVECNKAVEELNEKDISGYKLVVKRSDPSERTKRSDAAVIERREIFVRNLNPETQQIKRLKEMFAKFGEIEHVTIPKSSQDAHNGCAFITFSNKVAAEQSLALNGEQVDDRIISVQLSDNKAYIERNEVKRILNSRNFDRINSSIAIFPISDKVSREQLKDLVFNSCKFTSDDITKVYLVNDLNGAIVMFHDSQKAAKVRITLDHSKFQNKMINVGTISDMKKQNTEKKLASEPNTQNRSIPNKDIKLDIAVRASVQDTESPASETAEKPKSAMSNDDFRKMFLNK